MIDRDTMDRPEPDKTPRTEKPALTSSESYERGLTLRKAGVFDLAVKEFGQAAADPRYALKAYAQMGLCHKFSGRYEEAVAAFRKALQSPQHTSKETVQILYVLGRTLESLRRPNEALEAYRWIRREDPNYRDVEQRIQQLSSRRPSTGRVPHPSPHSWMGGIIRSWQDLLRPSR